jgi:hypothetical protein
MGDVAASGGYYIASAAQVRADAGPNAAEAQGLMLCTPPVQSVCSCPPPCCAAGLLCRFVFAPACPAAYPISRHPCPKPLCPPLPPLSPPSPSLAALQAIVAQPGTITGSIGVVVGKLNVGRTLEDVGVRTDAVAVSSSLSSGAWARTSSCFAANARSSHAQQAPRCLG